MPALVLARQIPAKLPPEFADGLKPAAVHDIGLERVEERLDVGVLTRCAAPRHALAHTAHGQAVPKRRPEILVPAIAVKDHADRGPAAPQGRGDHRARQP